MQASSRKDGSQLCHSCANYIKMNEMRPTSGQNTGATVRSPPAKVKSTSSSGVSCFTKNVDHADTILLSLDWQQTDRNDMRQLWDEHHHLVEEERSGRASLQRMWSLLQVTRGE